MIIFDVFSECVHIFWFLRGRAQRIIQISNCVLAVDTTEEQVVVLEAISDGEKEACWWHCDVGYEIDQVG